MKNLITIINLSIIIAITAIFTQSEKISKQEDRKIPGNGMTTENVSTAVSEINNTVRSNFSTWADNTKEKSSIDETIAEFLSDMTEARIMDLEQGKTAEQRGTTKFLKQYGSLMVKDQSNMLDELKEIAKDKDISIPTSLGSDKAEALEALKKVHGESFDKKFIKMMIIDHKRDVKKLERATHYGDADIQVFATKYLPIVKSHLDKIKALKQSN